jgi:hypothetical protein
VFYTSVVSENVSVSCAFANITLLWVFKPQYFVDQDYDCPVMISLNYINILTDSTERLILQYTAALQNCSSYNIQHDLRSRTLLSITVTLTMISLQLLHLFTVLINMGTIRVKVEFSYITAWIWVTKNT